MGHLRRNSEKQASRWWNRIAAMMNLQTAILAVVAMMALVQLADCGAARCLYMESGKGEKCRTNKDCCKKAGLVCDQVWGVCSHWTAPPATKPPPIAPSGHTCPVMYPYAFSQGSYCCKYNRENNGRSGVACDGGPLTLSSSCCMGNMQMACPYGRCRNYKVKKCPSSHPYAYYSGSYCCKVNKENPIGLSAACDGSPLSQYSECCYGNQQVKCPYGDGQCVTG